MGSLRKPAGHGNCGAEKTIESERSYPSARGVSITSDMLPVNHSSSVVVPPTATSSLPALSVVSAPVTFISNQLPASDSTNSLHGATDAPVTSQISPHTAGGITNSVSDVLTTASSNLITQSSNQSWSPGGYNSELSTSHTSLLTSNSVTSCVPTSLPLLPTMGSAIVQPSSTVVLMYGNQLPPVPRFTGEEDSSESGTYSDWLEQFEAVATLASWNEHAKLVNLTTRLRGTAYSFYRSCATDQRSNYKLLVEQLSKRFTPVELTAIQSQHFHDRRQSTKESVDEFAQELKKLFHKAYSSLARGGSEAESMGRSVLANQFVSGL